MNGPRVAFLYLRVSTSKQVAEGVGLDAQEAKCRAHAAHLGWTIGGVFRDEGISGREGLDGRPGLVTLIEAVKATPDSAVIVYSISRLARRQRLLWNLLDDRDGEGLPVVSATESFDLTTPMGRAMLGMIAVFAALDADMIGERTRDAMAELKAQGRKLGAPSMVDLGAVESVRKIQALYTTGKWTHRSLADEMNRRKVPTAKGGKWWPRTIRSALNATLPIAD